MQSFNFCKKYPPQKGKEKRKRPLKARKSLEKSKKRLNLAYGSHHLCPPLGQEHTKARTPHLFYSII
jgi:hypothetical protein